MGCLMSEHELTAFVCLVECACGRLFASDISEGDARTQQYEHAEECEREEANT